MNHQLIGERGAAFWGGEVVDCGVIHEALGHGEDYAEHDTWRARGAGDALRSVVFAVVNKGLAEPVHIAVSGTEADMQIGFLATGDNAEAADLEEWVAADEWRFGTEAALQAVDKGVAALGVGIPQLAFLAADAFAIAKQKAHASDEVDLWM